ncbi:MAG: CHASE2 domain-containing protein [Planctomycetota bacterium]|nr:CHASE2 domain-containing protein [Planctomycetota bacterium]
MPRSFITSTKISVLNRATYLEDRLFASFLVVEGVIDKEHVEAIITERKTRYDQGTPLLPLRYELIEQGIIDEPTADKVMEPVSGFLEAEKRTHGLFGHPLFGMVAVKKKFLTYDQLAVLMVKQHKLRSTGRKSQPIGQLALGLGMLSDSQIREISEAQSFMVLRWIKEFTRFAAKNKTVIHLGVPMILAGLVIALIHFTYFQKRFAHSIGEYLERMEWMSYDLRFRIRDGMAPIDPYDLKSRRSLWSEKRKAPTDVVIVDVDQRTMQRFENRWPFSRAEMGLLVDRLGEAGVKAVGWDVLFTSPDNPDEIELMKVLVKKFQKMHGIEESLEPQASTPATGVGTGGFDFGDFGKPDSGNATPKKEGEDAKENDFDFDFGEDKLKPEATEKPGAESKPDAGEKKRAADNDADFDFNFDDKKESKGPQGGDGAEGQTNEEQKKTQPKQAASDDADFDFQFGEGKKPEEQKKSEDDFDFPAQATPKKQATDPDHPAFYPVLMNAYQDMLHDSAFAKAITASYDNYGMRSVAAMYFIPEVMRETAKSQTDLDRELFGRSAFLFRVPLRPRTFEQIPKEEGGEERLLMDVETFIPSMVGVLGTIKPISDAVESQGFVNTIVDQDGILRAMWTAIPFRLNKGSSGIEFYPSMAFQTASYYLDKAEASATPSVAWTWDYQGAKAGAFARDSSIGNYKLDLAGDGRMLLNFYGDGNWKEFFEVTFCGEAKQIGTFAFKKSSDDANKNVQQYLGSLKYKLGTPVIARVVHPQGNQPDIERVASFSCTTQANWAKFLSTGKRKIEEKKKGLAEAATEEEAETIEQALKKAEDDYRLFAELLSPGHIFFFPPSQPKKTCQVVGTVESEGEIEVPQDGLTLKQAVERAGGFKATGVVDVRRSCLIRPDPGGSYSFQSIFLDGHLIDSIRIQQGDTLVLPRAYHRGQVFKYYSFIDIYDRKVHFDELKGKAVIVGSTSPELGDFLTTLYGEFPGLEIQATYCQNIIHNNPIRKRNLIAFNVSMLVGCTLAVSVFVGLLPQLWGLFAFFAAVGSYCILSYYYFAHARLWIDMVAPISGMCTVFGLVTLFRHFTEQREKKKVQGMFSTMVSPEVLEYMQENPDRFRLTGEKKWATLFFSDVAGFTTISESLTAEALALVLNRYLTPMSDIILSYGGYIDKYEGDAIMADFGVPIWTDEDKNSHAWKCCWSALDQQAKLQEVRRDLKEEFGVDIDVRMGMNTGEVSAGNMGSTQKMQYTVMGDAVNQAARFEPANKPFDTHIMIGKSTKDMSGDKIVTRFLAAMIVKGKTEPVFTYELLAKQGEASPELLKVIELFEQGWHLHVEQKWDEAIAKFDEVMAIRPTDGPSRVYKKMCQDYKLEPPKAGWKGEWIQKEK